jgi:hypothetical protein
MRALAVEALKNWLEGTRYPNMDHWAEYKKEAQPRGMTGTAPTCLSLAPGSPRSRPLRDRLGQWPAAGLDRGCARCHLELTLEKKRPSGQTKKLHSLPNLFAELLGRNLGRPSFLRVSSVFPVELPGAGGKVA